LGDYSLSDKFPDIIEKLLENEKIVFATPVYWYAMSGLMKTFFDRLTDLVTINKSVGRNLKGKEIFLFAVGSDKRLPAGFEVPFELTAKYFCMTFTDYIYFSTKHFLPDKENDNKIKEFIENVKKQ
jgi:multimeric flavodoxin WrbA